MASLTRAVGRYADELSLRRADEKKQEKDPPHTHCEEWMAEIDAALEDNSLRPADE